jgi:hypothetical protein
MTEKERLVNRIIEDLKANMYDSEEYIFDLVREALMQRTIEDLKDIN